MGPSNDRNSQSTRENPLDEIRGFRFREQVTGKVCGTESARNSTTQPVVKVECSADATKAVYLLQKSIKLWPFVVLNLTSSVPISLEEANKAVRESVMEVDASLIACSDRFRKNGRQNEFTFFVTDPTRLTEMLREFSNLNQGAKAALDCMRTHSIKLIQNGKPDEKQQASLLVQIMSYIQYETAFCKQKLKSRSGFGSKSLKDLLNRIACGQEELQNQIHQAVHEAHRTLLEASGVIQKQQKEKSGKRRKMAEPTREQDEITTPFIKSEE
ncbi:hypothetical protein PSENEW3_00002827 [Picochlorum sp. SENEW3]|nr:hypothetical protein PSENEW3_00002827 [Picochlorum sp. SENEW3]